MKVLAIISACLFACEIYAGESNKSWPDELSIQQEIERINVERKSMFGIDVNAVPRPSFPSIEIKRQKGFDVLNFAKKQRSRIAEVKRDSELLIFVSFSMDDESLRKLSIESEKIGAVLVLRGFHEDSLEKTTQRIASLNIANGNFQINPKAYKQYQITAVPSYVITKQSAYQKIDDAGCSLPDQFLSLSGEMPLVQALGIMEGASIEFKDVAKELLVKLEKSL